MRRYSGRWSVVTAAFAKPCSSHVNAFKIHVFRLTDAQYPVRQGIAPFLLVRFVVYCTFTGPLQMFVTYISSVRVTWKIKLRVCVCVCVNLFSVHI